MLRRPSIVGLVVIVVATARKASHEVETKRQHTNMINLRRPSRSLLLEQDMVNRLRGLIKGLAIKKKQRGDEEGANVVHLVSKFLTPSFSQIDKHAPQRDLRGLVPTLSPVTRI
jgi:hypothetical protein